MKTEVLKEILKENSKILVIFVIALVVLVSIAYFAKIFFYGKEPEVVFEPKEIKINFGIFEDEGFKKLEVFEGTSLPKEKGRENPFVPY